MAAIDGEQRRDGSSHGHRVMPICVAAAPRRRMHSGLHIADAIQNMTKLSSLATKGAGRPPLPRGLGCAIYVILPRVKGDVLSILEAAYAPAADADAWLGHALDALVPHFDRGYGVFAHRFHVVDGHLSRGPLTPRSKAGVVMDSLVRARGRHRSRLSGQCPRPPRVPVDPEAVSLRSHGGLADRSPWDENLGAHVRRRARQLVADALGIVASEPSGHGSVFFTPGVRGQLSVQTRAVWLRIATHLAAGHRLARDPQARTDAVLDPSGRLEHAEGDATIREERVALSGSATAGAIDRARGRLRRSHPQEALAPLAEPRAWPLVARRAVRSRRAKVRRRAAQRAPGARVEHAHAARGKGARLCRRRPIAQDDRGITRWGCRSPRWARTSTCAATKCWRPLAAGSSSRCIAEHTPTRTSTQPRPREAPQPSGAFSARRPICRPCRARTARW